MAKDFQTNSWEKGMNWDLSPHKMPPDMYHTLRNGQVVSSESGNMYGITNLRGNKQLFKFPTIPRTQIIEQVDNDGNAVSYIQWAVYNPDTQVLINGFNIFQASAHEDPLLYIFELLQNDLQVLIDNNHIDIYFSEQYRNIRITYFTDTTELQEVSHVNWVNPNETGNFEIKTQIRSDVKFVGGGDFLDDMVVFTVCEEGDDPFCQVWYLDYDDINNIVINTNAQNELSLETSLKYNNILGFDTNFPIRRVISLKETEEFGNIYWTDGHNPIYTLNLLDDESTNLPTNLLSLQTSSTYGNLMLRSIGFNGILPASSSVQFSYRLVTLSGAKTPFAPLSGIFPLSSISTSPLELEFYGSNFDPEEIISNRSALLELSDLDTAYDFIEIAAITYQYQNIPDVYLETGIPVPISSTLSYNFTGVNSINADVSEILRQSENILTANDLVTKDNRLIPLGITTRDDDLDFDARAYRFNSSGVAKILDANDNEISFTYNQLNTGSVTVPEDHDCINPFNDTDYEGTNANLYYRNRFGLVGGSGINVDYEVVNMELIAMENVTQPGTTNPGRFNNTEIRLSDNEIVDLNGELRNYISPTVSSYFKGYKRGEIYRFGIKFFDKYGISYPVKWVGDVKFPDRFNNVPAIDEQTVKCINGEDVQGFRLNIRDGEDMMKMYPLGLKFTINGLQNIRDKVSGFTIVRSHREQQDKSVLGEGVVNGSLTAESVGDASAWGEINIRPTRASINAAVSATAQRRYNNWICQFTSPESHNDQTRFGFTENDYLTITDLEASSASGDSIVFNKSNISDNNAYNQCRKISTLQFSSFTDINDITDNPFSAGNVPDYYNARTFYTNSTAGPNTILSYWCTTRKNWLSSSGVGNVNRLIPDETIANTDHVVWIGNYKRDIVPTQYGGNLHTLRPRTKYIDVTNFVKIVANNNQEAIVFKGDTSCHYWDVLWGGFSVQTGAETFVENYTKFKVVIESSYNLEYRPKERIDYTLDSVILPMLDSQFVSDLDYAKGIKPSDWSLVESYDYNQAYNQPNNIRFSYQKDNTSRQTGTLLSVVWPSEPKIFSERIDSWRTFLPANLYDLEAVYGPINRGELLNDQIIAFQDRGIAFVPINERVMINDENSTALVLGTGDVVGKHKYISTTAGTKQPFSVCKTDRGIYYVDTRHKKLSFISTDGGGDLSVVKGMDTYFRDAINGKEIINTFNPLNNKGIVSVYDQETNRLHFTLLGIYLDPTTGNPLGETIVLNERDQTFRYFLDHDPRYYMTNGNVILTPKTSDLKSMYLETHGVYGVYFDNIFQPKPMTLSFYVNKHAPLTKTANNIQFDGEGFIAVDVPPFGGNTSIFVENNFDGTLANTDIRKRFHTYRHTIGRVKTNQRSRVTGPWFRVTIQHENWVNQLINIHDVITYFDVYNLNLQN